MSALISFLGGSVFRMIWGELSAAWTRKQEHDQEMDRIDRQETLSANQHARNQEAIKTQHAFGIEVIHVQSEAKTDELVTDAWAELVKSTAVAPKVVGIAWVDAWIGAVGALNASIRPGVAVWAVIMMTLSEFTIILMSDDVSSICFAVLGVYLADRTLQKRGK